MDKLSVVSFTYFMIKKNTKGFAHLGLFVLLLVIVATIGVTGWQVYQHQQNKNQTSYGYSYGPTSQTRDYAFAGNGGDSSAKNLPACTTDALLNHAPTSDLTSIEGLGHTNGEHILPIQADHIYVLPPANGTATNYVYAPGDVTLLQVVAAKHTAGRDATLNTDYSITFAPCKSVMFGYLHVSNLTSPILNAMAAVKPNCDNSGTLETNCVYQDLSLKLTSGEQIGTSNSPQNGIDFGATDVRTPTLAFINKMDITGGMLGDSYTHNVCPLDYFTSSLKSELYDKITIKNAGANGIPACGAIMQDKAGTSQGNWYMPGLAHSSQGNGLTELLGLVHYNMDPSKAVLSAGSQLLPSNDYGDQIIYQPISSGYINPDPSRITPDGHVYCIEGQSQLTDASIHVNVQMTDQSTLKASYGTGSCASRPSLDGSAITYNR